MLFFQLENDSHCTVGRTGPWMLQHINLISHRDVFSMDNVRKAQINHPYVW